MKPDRSGGNGNIYFGEDQTATKYLRNTSSKERIERFQRELSVLKELSVNAIPNIVEIIEVNIDKKNILKSYVKMKKYDGPLTDLFAFTRGNAKKTLNLIVPVIQALKKLSESKPAIYHRDLKPDNILYFKNDGYYDLYLTDFGTCFLDDGAERLTPENIAVGARMFLAPEYEMCRVEEINEKGDIFSLGKIIWCMINGEKDIIFPSNFWFIDEFDLSKKYPSDIDIIGANLVIAACLSFKPEERCNYDELLVLIKNILCSNISATNVEKMYRVKQFQERRKIELLEIKKRNILIVNSFSIIYVKVLKQLCVTYPNFTFLEKLLDGYVKKSKDGINYTTKNVENDSAHYMFSMSYDNIYYAIEYHPAVRGARYANITINYSIYSSGKNEKIKISYNMDSVLSSEYKGTSYLFGEKSLLIYLDELIMAYIA